MLVNETKEIEGKTHFVRQMPAQQSLKFLSRLTKHTGGHLPQLVEGNLDIRGVLAMLKASEEDDLIPLIRDLVCMVRVDNEEITSAKFDMMFKGNMMYLFKVFAFCCEVQYRDFFEQGLSELESNK